MEFMNKSEIGSLTLKLSLALAENQTWRRLGAHPPSGALGVVGGRKRQRAVALQDLWSVGVVCGAGNFFVFAS